MKISNLTSLQPSLYAVPESELFLLKSSLIKESFLSKEEEEILNQINALHYAEIFPSKIAILLKNHLNDPLTFGRVLSSFVLELVRQEKMVPTALERVGELCAKDPVKGPFQAILYLYTSHLQEEAFEFPPLVVQEQVWKYEEKDLVKRMQEMEEMQCKTYLLSWLKKLDLSAQEKDLYIAPILKPLKSKHFQKQLKELFKHLLTKEGNLIYKLCLEEFSALLKEENGLQLLANSLRAFDFYRAHIEKIRSLSLEIESLSKEEKQDWIQSCQKAHRFSFYIAADAIKNGPRARDLQTSYCLLAGKIKAEWERIENQLSENAFPKTTLIARGISKDEEIALSNIQELFQALEKKVDTLCIPKEILETKPMTRDILGILNSESLCKNHHAFRILNLFRQEGEEGSQESKQKLIQYLLKKNPSSIVAPLSHQHRQLLLESAKALEIPITFLAINTDVDDWEEISYFDYPHFTLVFPRLPSEDIPQEINKEKVAVCGLPVLQRSKLSSLDLKEKWGLPLDCKIVLLSTPEGDPTWSKFLAEHYGKEDNLVLAVLTEEENKTFLYDLHTKIAPSTSLPIYTYTSLTPEEKEELLLMADLVIDKNKQGDRSILLESNQAGTRLLIDNTPPSFFSRGISGFLLSSINSLLGLFGIDDELAETRLHEKFLEEQNLGKMIHSKDEFKHFFEELLQEEFPIATGKENFQETFPQIVQEIEAKAPSETFLQKPLVLFQNH
jgi:hypothetical protein